MSYLHGLKNLLADKEVSYLIPQVVQSAFPTMSIDQFVVCCQDPAFRYASVKVSQATIETRLLIPTDLTASMVRSARTASFGLLVGCTCRR